MQPVRTPDGLYSLPIATLHCCQRRSQPTSLTIRRSSVSSKAAVPVLICNKQHDFIDGDTVDWFISSTCPPPASLPRGETVKTAQVWEFFSPAWFFRWVLLQAVWLRRAAWKGGGEGEWEEEVVMATHWPPPVFTHPLKDTVRRSPTILFHPAGGDTGLDAQTESGRTISCWKQHALLPPRFGKIVILQLEYTFKTLPRILPPCRSPFPKRVTVPGPSAGVASLAELSCGSVCAAVNLRWRAATWCGPAPLGASRAAADPSCRAAWTAQCCDPGSIPWGTPGTEAQMEEKKKKKKKGVSWTGGKETTGGAMCRVKGSYLRVHFRVPATFTFP